MNYIAYNLQGRECGQIDICRNCNGNPPRGDDTGLENCWGVTDTVYYISDYYSVKGVD